MTARHQTHKWIYASSALETYDRLDNALSGVLYRALFLASSRNVRTLFLTGRVSSCLHCPGTQVTPVYSASHLPGNDETVRKQLVEAVTIVLPKLHSLLIGPGLGRDTDVLRAAADIVQEASRRNLPVVLDADSITMVINTPGVVRGCPFVVLTPNANEFRNLCKRMERDNAEQGDHSSMKEEATMASTGVVEKRETEDSPGGELRSKVVTVERLADYLGGVTIVLKGKEDIISNGSRTIVCAVPGGLKRCGGIGDVLSGAMATSLAWVYLRTSDAREVRSAGSR